MLFEPQTSLICEVLTKGNQYSKVIISLSENTVIRRVDVLSD